MSSPFQKVYVISLPHKLQRQEQIKKELSRVGITNYTLHKAANGKEKDIQDLARRLQILDAETLPYFAPGHLGCLVSHYTLWLQIFLSEPSENWYLILEDDARFHPSVTSEMLTEIWNDLPSDATLAKFHSSNGYSDNPNLFSESATPFWLKQKRLTFSLMAYAVHTSALKSLLITKWRNHVDLFHMEGMYIAKRIEDSPLYISNLYTSEGLFSQGICIPNNSQDSDTADEIVESSQAVSTQPVKQLMDGQTYQEGDMSIYLYDEVRPSGVCHISFGFHQKLFTYMD